MHLQGISGTDCRSLFPGILPLPALLQRIKIFPFLKKVVDKQKTACYYVQALSDSSARREQRWASGGIGRLARFRFQCSLRTCGFKSRLAHQSLFLNELHMGEWWNWQTRQIQVLVFTADVRVQVPPRPPKKDILSGILLLFCLS